MLRNRKLTDDEVRVIRYIHLQADPRYSNVYLAKMYGVSITTMRSVVEYLSYKNVGKK